MEAIVDHSLCIGCGLCVENCPEVFEMKKDKTINVKAYRIPLHCFESIHNAIMECPAASISVEKIEKGKDNENGRIPISVSGNAAGTQTE